MTGFRVSKIGAIGVLISFAPLVARAEFPQLSPRGQMDCMVFSSPQSAKGPWQEVIEQKGEPFDLGFKIMDIKLPAPYSAFSIHFAQTVMEWPENGGEIRPYLQAYFVKNALPQGAKKDLNFALGEASGDLELTLRDSTAVSDKVSLLYRCRLRLLK